MNLFRRLVRRARWYWKRLWRCSHLYVSPGRLSFDVRVLWCPDCGRIAVSPVAPLLLGKRVVVDLPDGR